MGEVFPQKLHAFLLVWTQSKGENAWRNKVILDATGRWSFDEWQAGSLLSLAKTVNTHSPPATPQGLRDTAGQDKDRFILFPTTSPFTRYGMEMAENVESVVSNSPRQEGIHHTPRPHIPGEEVQRGHPCTISHQDSGQMRGGRR